MQTSASQTAEQTLWHQVQGGVVGLVGELDQRSSEVNAWRVDRCSGVHVSSMLLNSVVVSKFDCMRVASGELCVSV